MMARKTCWWWTGADEDDILDRGDRGSRWESVVVSRCMDWTVNKFSKLWMSSAIGNCVIGGARKGGE